MHYAIIIAQRRKNYCDRRNRCVRHGRLHSARGQQPSLLRAILAAVYPFRGGATAAVTLSPPATAGKLKLFATAVTERLSLPTVLRKASNFVRSGIKFDTPGDGGRSHLLTPGQEKAAIP